MRLWSPCRKAACTSRNSPQRPSNFPRCWIILKMKWRAENWTEKKKKRLRMNSGRNRVLGGGGYRRKMRPRSHWRGNPQDIVGDRGQREHLTTRHVLDALSVVFWKAQGTCLVVQGWSFSFQCRAMQVQSLVRELGLHMSGSQKKKKKKTRGNIVANSVETLKMVHSNNNKDLKSKNNKRF